MLSPSDAKPLPELELRPDNPYLPVLRSLESKGLLVRLDTSDPDLHRVVHGYRERYSPSSGADPSFCARWQQKLDQAEAQPPRMVPPWKPSHTDELLVNGRYFPEVVREQERILTTPG
jgi:hypothetical protein